MKIKVRCKLCGEIEIDTHFEDDNGAMYVPVVFAKTIKDLRKYVDGVLGEPYEALGSTVEDSFEREFITPLHLSPDDAGVEEAKRHKLEPIECWAECII